MNWHHQHPEDWEATWQRIEDKCNDNPNYRRFSCNDEENIDAKINGAYIVMGLLYGEGDIDKTIIISTRCGQDSDCNPSNAAGVLFTSLGFSHLPERFTSALNEQARFSFTPYSFPILVHVCETLTRQAVLREGGRIERDDEGRETFVIPVQKPKPSALEQCWEPGPIANSRFTDKEMAQIVPPRGEKGEAPADIADMSEAIERFASGWSVKHCGVDMYPGLHYKGLPGQADWLLTHPQSQEVACILFKRIEVPAGKTRVHLTVAHHSRGDWVLKVNANGEELLKTIIGIETTVNNTRDIKVDLSKFAGSEIMLELVNEADDWANEVAYWGKIAIVTE